MNHNNLHSAVSASNSGATTSRGAETMPNQRWAFVCVAVAWLIGTLVFELTATGAEAAQVAPTGAAQLSMDTLTSTNDFVDRMQHQHAISELLTSSMDQMLRLAASSDLIDRCDALIAESIVSKPSDGLASSNKTQHNNAQEKSAKLTHDVAMVPDSMMVDPMLEIMPVSKWITQFAYQQLDKRSLPVGLKRLGDKRLAFDQARTSALPGLMRLLVSADRQSATAPKKEVPDGVVATSYRDRKESEVRRAVGSLVSVSKIANAGGQSSMSMASTKNSTNNSMPRFADAVARPENRVALKDSQTIPLKRSGTAKIETNLPTEDDIALVPRAAVPAIMPVPAKVKSPAVRAEPREQPIVRVAAKPATVPVATQVPAVTVAATQPPNAATAVESIGPPMREPREVRVQTINEPAKTPSVVAVEAPIRQERETNVAVADSNEATESSDETLRIAQWPFKKDAPAAGADAKVTLNVQDTDVRSVLEMLARGYGMNILISPEVSGVVTANISGLSPDETLQSVLRLCNLHAQNDGNAIFIYPEDSLPEDIRIVRHFQLDYARAETVEPAVQGLVTKGGRAYVTKMDAADNLRSREAIVVVDTPESVERIADYLRHADRAPRQVMIEAHVLEVELKDDMFHGVNLEALVRGNLSVKSFGLADATASATNPLFWAQIDGSRVKSVIEALESTTDTKTLAQPKVMVVNGQSSRIQVGNQIGYSTVIQNQSGSTIENIEFLDTGVILDVTPTIGRDNRIMMLVKPEVSTEEFRGDVPGLNTRELETSVLLDNHQGVVIGGLIQEKDSTIIRKLPWLGDVKHVGKLFQRREAVRSRSEIIIALVPHIIDMDEHPDQDCFDHEGWHTEYERTKGPLLYGPLQRNCRPWEARLPDSATNHSHLDVDRINQAIP